MIWTILLGIAGGVVTAFVIVFLWLFLTAIGRVKVENIELQKRVDAYKENAQKQAQIISKLAEENAVNKPFSIHFSDEQVFHLAHMITEHMETLNGPKN